MQAERRVLDAKHEYDHVCKLVKVEVARFERERIDDFKDTLHAFLEGMISRQKEVRASVSGCSLSYINFIIPAVDIYMGELPTVVIEACGRGRSQCGGFGVVNSSFAIRDIENSIPIGRRFKVHTMAEE